MIIVEPVIDLNEKSEVKVEQCSVLSPVQFPGISIFIAVDGDYPTARSKILSTFVAQRLVSSILNSLKTCGNLNEYWRCQMGESPVDERGEYSAWIDASASIRATVSNVLWQSFKESNEAFNRFSQQFGGKNRISALVGIFGRFGLVLGRVGEISATVRGESRYECLFNPEFSPGFGDGGLSSLDTIEGEFTSGLSIDITRSYSKIASITAGSEVFYLASSMAA